MNNDDFGWADEPYTAKGSCINYNLEDTQYGLTLKATFGATHKWAGEEWDQLEMIEQVNTFINLTGMNKKTGNEEASKHNVDMLKELGWDGDIEGLLKGEFHFPDEVVWDVIMRTKGDKTYFNADKIRPLSDNPMASVSQGRLQAIKNNFGDYFKNA